MKQIKISLFSLLAAFISSNMTMAAVNPSAVNIKIYGVAVSTNADCTGAKVIGYNASGTTYNFMANPAIISGAVAAGTYNCVILYMDSAISFVPAANDGANCTAGQTYQQVLCHQANSCNYTNASPDSANILQVNNDSIAATAANATATSNSDKVLLFLSTSSTNTSGGTFLRPSASTWATRGLALTSPLVVSASGTGGSFVVNFNGKVVGDGSAGPLCGVNAPLMGFR